MRLLVVLLAALAAVGALAGPIQAQETDTVSAPLFPDRSSWENGYLNRFSMDREPQGARSRGMGGTGLAVPGGPEAHVQNPAAILGMRRPELSAHATFYSGGAGIKSFPSEFDVGVGEPLTASDYRVNPRETLDYNGLFFGLPIMLLGERAGIALSYRRIGLTGFPDESRTNLQGAITNQAQAVYGVEDNSKDGMDAVTLSLARTFLSRIDLGMNLNWEGGKLARDGEVGISVVGNVFATGTSSFEQKVKAFSLDGGALVNLGRLRLGGSLYAGHDLEFYSGKSENLTLPDPPAFTNRFLVNGLPLNHTLTVPTMFGVGGSYAVNERLTVAADFQYRPWSQAKVTRTRLEPLMGFAVANGESSFVPILVPGDNDSLWNAYPLLIARGFRGRSPSLEDPSNRQETLNAQLHDTHSLRLGLEYYLKKTESFDLPVRLGFRFENLTFNNIRIPTLVLQDTTVGDHGVLTGDTMYGESIEAYKRILRGDTECTSGDCRQLENFLLNVLEYNHMAFQGDPVKAGTITLGIGVRVSEWSADLTIERTGFSYDRFFLSPFDPLLNPILPIAHEKRSFLNLTFSTTMRF